VRHVQPAFFYPTPGAVAADYYVHTRRATGAGARAQDANHGLDADGSLYLDPEEDEECKRGIPVFKPTMEVSHPAVPCRDTSVALEIPADALSAVLIPLSRSLSISRCVGAESQLGGSRRALPRREPSLPRVRSRRYLIQLANKLAVCLHRRLSSRAT
jgi:hypothetical protein